MHNIRKLKRNWKIHLIHHTHVDIGFTHTQADVLQRQFSHTYKAMDLVELAKNKPESIQFRWNPEVTWAIKPWYDQASPVDQERFIAMIRSGHMGIDGLFGNLLTGLCRPEELKENFYNAQFFAELSGVPVTSAMITDVPGWNWGLVKGLAEQGIQYLSAGPNHFDRIGYTLKSLGDKPCYWVSPSGTKKVLLYTHGKGYAWFHTKLNSEGKKNKFTPRRVAGYLHKLEKENYPYNTVLIRYNIGSDNGPPDAQISDVAEAWNKAYPNVQIRLSTTAMAMQAFEHEYGSQLPVVKGDITPYWEDGAFSTARETAIAREASERMSQLQALMHIASPLTLNTQTSASPAEKVDALQPVTSPSLVTESPEFKQKYRQAWENVLLYNEHTWGAHTSITKPDHPFAISQWNCKKQYALDASESSKQLIESITGGRLIDSESYETLLGVTAGSTTPANLAKTVPKIDGHDPEGQPRHITLYNTHDWGISDIIRIPALAVAATVATNSDGIALPTQRLHSGELAVQSGKIPALGSTTVSLCYEADQIAGETVSLSSGIGNTMDGELADCKACDNPCTITVGSNPTLTNGLVQVVVNSDVGTIASIQYQGKELVQSDPTRQFNQYVLLATKYFGIEKRPTKDETTTVEVLDKGPLIATLRITRTVPRCHSMVTEISIQANSPNIYLNNWLDRPISRKKEGIHFEFPFAFPQGRVRYDVLWGSAELNKDQLSAANKNFITATRWVDISNPVAALESVGQANQPARSEAERQANQPAESPLGVTCVLLDAPTFKSAKPHKDPFRTGSAKWCGWLQKAPYNGTIYSYVMNNYWMTNYKADQPGKTLFRYVFIPHGEFNETQANRHALEAVQPLIGVWES